MYRFDIVNRSQESGNLLRSANQKTWFKVDHLREGISSSIIENWGGRRLEISVE